MNDSALKRFVAFAFSAADVLIETDLEGKIAFTAGAVSTVKTLANAKNGTDLPDSFEPVSRRIIRTLMETAPEEGRAGPAQVWCEDQAYDLSLWRMKGSPSFQWALRRATSETSSEETPFPQCAYATLEDAQRRGRALDLAMVWLDGGEHVRWALGDREADQFFASLNEIARLHAHGGAAGSIVGAGDIIGIVTDNASDLSQLELEFDEIARSLGLERVSARSARLEVGEGALDTAIEVFVEAATRFHESGEQPKEATLSAFVEKARRLAEARTAAVTLTVRNKMFEPYVQALVCAETHEPLEYEVLIRLPGGRSFVPGLLLAEQIGMTQDLDLTMTEAALKFLQTCPNRPALSVNLSGASLISGGFGDKLAGLLRGAKIDPRRLCFEVTETCAIQDFDHVRAITEGLRRRGHPVALDDFGAGAAGLEYMLRLPVDRVKIDGALMPRTTPSEWERKVFSSIADSSHAMGATIVAEHVEHRWQALVMSQEGFDLLQGYLFAAPEPLNELVRRHPPRLRREDEPAAAFG